MVADLAAQAPSRFGALAREYSDDVVTRDRGGSLGGSRATQLPREFLDALAVLRPGQVSRVVRTSFGYHVLLRRAPPGEALVSARRVVFRYANTLGGLPNATTGRSRAEALGLALRVAAEARAGALPFEKLVERYSENPDRAQGGDIGVYSVRDPGYLPQQIERLETMALGDVSEPMDSPVGFQVLKRTEVQERAAYAMSAIAIRFDPTLQDAQENSRADAMRLAERLSRELRENPDALPKLQERYCCAEARRWTAGRGPIGLSSVLDGLRTGEIASRATEADWFLWIPKKLDPAVLPPVPPPAYELPEPKAPDFDTLVSTGTAVSLSQTARRLARESRRALRWDHAEDEALGRVLEALAVAFEGAEDSPSRRLSSWHASLDELKGELAPEHYAQFRVFLERWAVTQLMEQGA